MFQVRACLVMSVHSESEIGGGEYGSVVRSVGGWDLQWGWVGIDFGELDSGGGHGTGARVRFNLTGKADLLPLAVYILHCLRQRGIESLSNSEMPVAYHDMYLKYYCDNAMTSTRRGV